MKKMKIEKQLIFADHVMKVASLSVSQGLHYKHEDDGIRAMGPLFIQGEYVGDNGIEKFQETLEMDILAPEEKLSGENFYLEVADYQGLAVDDGIQILVTLHIHGLKEGSQEAAKQVEESKVLPDPLPKPSEVIEKAVAAPKEIRSLPIAPAPTKKEANEHAAIEKTDEKEIEKEEINTASVDDFEDLFADTESTYTSYRIIVAKENDTYTGIAQRYEVDENALRDTNKNKEILPKTLVILPFQQK